VELVIEILNRSGHALTVNKFAKSRVNIGRGFDQTLIIDDPFIDASHIQIRLDENSGEIECIDLASLNGVVIEPQFGKKYRLLGAAKISSGDIVAIGRTRMRILHSQHAVATAQPLTSWHFTVHRLSVWPMVAFVGLLVALLSILESYLNLPHNPSLRRYALESVYVLLSVIGYGVIWASIGHSLKGDGRLATQLLLGCVGIIVLSMLDFALPWFAYHLPNEDFWMIFSKVMTGLVLFAVVYFSVRLATRVKPLAQLLVAAVVPLAILLNLMIRQLDGSENVNHVPYQRVLIAPSINVRESLEPEAFVKMTQSLYLEVDNQASQKSN
jgi:hypothetical protein